jgi:hypothetical protein
LSWNCTVPLAVPAPGELTLVVAVKVTGAPYSEGFVEEAIEVVVSAGLTLWPPLNAPLLSPSTPRGR